MLRVKQFCFSNFGVNTYVAVDEATREAAVIDPAMQTAAEQEEFNRFIADHHIRLTQVINTHLHLDHCFGESYVTKRYNLPVKAHSADAPLGNEMAQQYRKFGMMPVTSGVIINVPLRNGDEIHIGESTLKVIHTPGHTPGGICLYDEADHLLFSGDTLFHGSVGRTDLPGGNMDELLESIRTKLLSLPDDTTVLPGHDRLTTIGNERKYNPFV